jgi:hypothetical protein
MVGDDLAGRRIPCPDCGVSVAVPDLAPAATAARRTRLWILLGIIGLGVIAGGLLLMMNRAAPQLLAPVPPPNDVPTRITIREKRFAEEGTLEWAYRLSKPRPMIGLVREIRLKKGICYRIALRSEKFEPRLIVLDARGEATSDKRVGKIQNEAIEEFLPPADGDWRIVVTSADGMGVGDYELRVAVDEEKSLPDVTITVLIGPGDQVEAPRSMLGRVHRKNLKKGMEYTFQARGRGFDAVTSVMDPKKQQLLRETSILLPGAVLFFSPAEDGEYEIIVSSTTGTAVGEYDLHFRQWDAESTGRMGEQGR